MSDIALVVERWRVNARAAGIDLPDAVVEATERAGTLGQVVALEELLRRLDPGFVMPDALARPWDVEPEDA